MVFRETGGMIPPQSFLIGLFEACHFAGSLLWTVCLKLRVFSNSECAGRQNQNNTTTTHSRWVPPSVCTSYLWAPIWKHFSSFLKLQWSAAGKPGAIGQTRYHKHLHWFDCRVWGFRCAKLPWFFGRFPAGQLVLISNMASERHWKYKGDWSRKSMLPPVNSPFNCTVFWSVFSLWQFIWLELNPVWIMPLMMLNLYESKVLLYGSFISFISNL